MPRPTAFTYASFSVHSRTKWRALSEPSAHPGTQHNESIIPMCRQLLDPCYKHKMAKGAVATMPTFLRSCRRAADACLLC